MQQHNFGNYPDDVTFIVYKNYSTYLELFIIKMLPKY